MKWKTWVYATPGQMPIAKAAEDLIGGWELLSALPTVVLGPEQRIKDENTSQETIRKKNPVNSSSLLYYIKMSFTSL